MFLDLGAGGRWKLRHLLMRDLVGDLELNPHLRPDTEDFFSIDVAGQLKIGDIIRLVVDIGQTSDASTWHPESIAFSIDGKEVYKIAITGDEKQGIEQFPTPPHVSHLLQLPFPK